VIGLLLACIFTPVQADDAKPASSNVPGAESPKIHPDGRVTFRLRTADAKKVQLKPGGEGRTSWWMVGNGLAETCSTWSVGQTATGPSPPRPPCPASIPTDSSWMGQS